MPSFNYAKLIALGQIAQFEIGKVVEAISAGNRFDERRHYECFKRADDIRNSYMERIVGGCV